MEQGQPRERRDAWRAAGLVILALTAGLSLTGIVPAEPGPAELEVHEAGHHIVTHVWVEDRNGPDHTAVAAAVDGDGELVMYAYVQYAWLYISDGVDGDGEPVERQVGRFWLADWSRLDLTFDGDTYTLLVDQIHGVTASTLTPANEAALLAHPGQALPSADAQALLSRTRSDPGDGSGEETFASVPGPTSPWQPVVTTGEIEFEPDATGHEGRGHAIIWPSRDEGVAYLTTSLGGYGSHYALEVSLMIGALLPPAGQALLAGVHGEPDAPTVDWALVMDLPPLEDLALSDPTQDTRALYFQTADGERTHLVTWRGLSWHWVRVIVDEDAGSLEVLFDGGSVGTFQGLDLASSTAAAVGDVDTAYPDLSGGGVRFDDVAVYPVDHEVVA